MAKKYQEWREFAAEVYSPAELAEIQAEAATEVQRIRLRELRKRLGLTQVQASERINISQADLSKMERRRDHKLSTVQRYVEGMGAKLRMEAVFPDGQVVKLIDG